MEYYSGTGEHHPYSVAESMYRGMAPEVVVAQACAHNHPGWENDEVGPVNWIKAAAIMAGKDPVKEGYLSPSGKNPPDSSGSGIFRLPFRRL